MRTMSHLNKIHFCKWSDLKSKEIFEFFPALPKALCFPSIEFHGPRSTPTVPQSWWSCAERQRWMATSSWSPRRLGAEVAEWKIKGCFLMRKRRAPQQVANQVELELLEVEALMTCQAKLLFVVRIAGIIKMSPKPRTDRNGQTQRKKMVTRYSWGKTWPL